MIRLEFFDPLTASDIRESVLTVCHSVVLKNDLLNISFQEADLLIAANYAKLTKLQKRRMYRGADQRDWDARTDEGENLRTHGITVCIEDLPNDKPLRLFRLTAKHRTEYIVTNDVSIETAKAAKKVGGFRWKIEQFHREVKQLTGASKCQARKGRKQRNHICIAFVVWHQLNEIANQMKTTMYEVKHMPLKEYQKQLWRNPAYKFELTDFA